MTQNTSVSGRRDRVVLPIWLRRLSAPRPEKRGPTPREFRWWGGVVSIVLSFVLLGFVGHATLLGALQQSQTQAQLYAALRGTLANATTPLGQLDVNSALVAPGTPIAFLRIGRVQLSQVVVQGTSSDVLRSGPGHRSDTVMPGQHGTSVIFGRQSTYGGPFAALATLVPGDKITVTTGQGTSTFTVFGLRRPGDREPKAATAHEGRLELVTADGPALMATGTLYVDAVLTSKTMDAPSMVYTEAALGDGQQAMQPAPNAVLPFLFSLQWLIIAAAVTLWLTRVWGRRQTWMVAIPLLLILGATTADSAVALLPNLV